MMAFREQDNMPGATFLQGGGEMGARMRAFAWKTTPLGDPETWPESLKTALRICLASRQPMWVWWGPQLINFYNDAYLSIIGAKHPAALGQPARIVWREIWDQICERIDAAMAGESSYAEAELLVMHRHGYPEETYYTFSFSPVPDAEGHVGGIMCANTDDTEWVIGARRLAMLHDLAARTGGAETVAQVYALGAESLATNRHDMPFALLYNFDAQGCAHLCGASGIAPGDAAAPETIAADVPNGWPAGEVLRSGRGQMVQALGTRFGGMPSGPWSDAPDEALLLPLRVGGEALPRGLLVIGLSPYRARNEAYEEFARLAAGQIASAILNTEAFEAEHARARFADSLALEVEQRRRVERQQTLLLDELNHRVKNTLATVQAIAMQTLKGVDAAARETFLARLFALSGQHDLLAIGHWESTSLEEVVSRALRSYHDKDASRIAVAGPAVQLNPKRALALGMAFHELATNAARHGALSNPGGSVAVRWTVDAAANALHLEWTERGGPRLAPPRGGYARGFGLRLIEKGLAREISGTVAMEFTPEGLVCSWDMPLLS